MESAIPSVSLETDANEEVILENVRSNLKVSGNYVGVLVTSKYVKA